MSRWIFNTSATEKTYLGVPIPAGQVYAIPTTLLAAFSSDAVLLADLANSVVKMSSDGATAYSGSPSQQIDFLKGSLPIRVTPAGLRDPENLRARIIGTHFATVSAGQTQNIDWVVSQLVYNGVGKDGFFDGVQYYAKNSEIGDTVSFQIVHPSLGVLDEFASGFYIVPNSSELLLLYRARLYVGTTVRIVYTSTGQTDVNFVCNLFRHMDTT